MTSPSQDRLAGIAGKLTVAMEALKEAQDEIARLQGDSVTDGEVPHPEHPIRASLKKLRKPLALNETIDAYIASVDRPRPKRHAFAVVMHFSGGSEDREQEEIDHLSDNPDTNSQRGNAGAVITLLDWVQVNAAEANPIIVHSVDQFIVDIRGNLRNHPWNPRMADLYEKLEPLLEACPYVSFEKLNRDERPKGVHHTRHAHAAKLAGQRADAPLY